MLLEISATTSSMATTSSSLTFYSSSSSIRPRNHDVFLSFRGKDVRQKFVSHLYHALDKRGISTCIDSQLERGEKLSLALFEAIEGSMISIIVFSKNYAKSRWCLEELLKVLECKEAIKQIVLPIFYDIDPSEVQHQKGSFGKSFDKLGDKIKDKVKVMKWKAALKEVANFSGFVLANRKESEFIQEIIQWVDFKIVNQTPLSVAKYPIGMDFRIQRIYEHLSIGRNDIVCIIGIFGTGGIGKTTISKDIYNRISSQFEGSCLLKNIRETSKQAGGLIQLQNRLLYDILGTSLEVRDTDIGINVIRHKLCSKRVLLILDDVTELIQIDKLAGGRDWFGSGSRIIITTRDQHLLDNSKVDSKHEVSFLDDNEALQLFSLHAFDEMEPLKDYVDLSKQVIRYAKGLPLALVVLGSDLKGKSIRQWKSALGKYKNIPNKNLQEVLLVSYEGLDGNEKEMFLDIAFFFNGEPLVKITEIFDSCRFYPDDGIIRLIDKCLITVEDENVLMHDLLQDLGREIVRLESPEQPSKRSRLWFHEDICEVLEENMIKDTNKIEGIIIEMPKGEEVISLSPEAFVRMNKLRVLINRNASFSSGPNYLSNNLRVLDWFEYPHHSLPPNFHGNKLIIFKMHGSFIKELGGGFKFKNLTNMALNDCNFLTTIPDLSSVSNLKELVVVSCKSLVEVHDSVGSLDNLSLLSFSHCSNLRIFPSSLKLRSLCDLCLTDCSSFRKFPEIECKMESLRTLYLEGTAIEELPLSIENLGELNILNLNGCKNLIRLPRSIISQLQNLCAFGIGDCENLVKKMGDERQPILAIESTTMKFFPISSFFAMITSSATLKILHLHKTQLVSLPKSIKRFSSLSCLDLYGCEKLEEILELPPNISCVLVGKCKLLERFQEVSRILEFNGSHIRSLKFIQLNCCDKMHEYICNYRVPNPLFWKGYYDYDASLFLENHITEQCRYQKEFLESEIVKRQDGAQMIGTEGWVIDMEGPHHLEDISGIVLYAILFYEKAVGSGNFIFGAEITSNSSNYVRHIGFCEGLQLFNNGWNEMGFGYSVWSVYTSIESFGVKVLDYLRVKFHPNERDCYTIPIYKSCGANVVYKHESRANKKRKMDGINRCFKKVLNSY